MSDYKKTLNLPYTKFPMRANLPDLEHKILHRWYTDNLYESIRLKKNKKKIFLLHDGPPYANGDIHLGHAVNKILKDIILKFKGLSGYDAPYIPGWDCHGLPIELQVEQLIRKTGICVNSKKFRNICRQYVINQIEIQKKDFKRLGVLGDWDHPYLTMDFKTEANIIRSLGKIILNGYFYKGVKPVYWCFQCASALANSEVEYHNQQACAIDVGFSVINICNINKIFNTNFCEQNIEFIIWTTTIWTIPANQAISVHPHYMYQLIKIINNKYIIIAAQLVNAFMKRIECFSWTILGESLGKSLEYLFVRHPFMSVNVPVVLSNHITLDSGTGIVHIAPNYGPDDYCIAQKYKFKKIIDLIDDKGYYVMNIHPKLQGLHIFESKDIIVALLNQSDNFLYINDNYQHSYPHCWRHIKPLIFRVTSQWFLNLEHKNLRDKLLNIVQKVNWIPKTGCSSMTAMVMNRPDWCLSRQRVWGIPIPVLIHKTTNTLHPNTFNLIEKVAQLVEKHGIQVWWDLKIEDFIIDTKEAIHYQKIYDTLDVWFDSGSTYDSVIVSEKFKYLGRPVDLYLEGSDQYRGWFMSSLIISVAITGQSPYKEVLSHGFIVDARGNKMSKSLGNVISPKNIINKFGSDILRLWIASSDYSKDMAISNNILKHVTDVYRRIRNTIRFCLANLDDFNPIKNIIQPQNMVQLDLWAIDHTLSTQLQIISDYEKYQFHNVIQHIMRFCSIEMGSFYLDVIKDRQYTSKKDSLSRRSCQTTLYHIVEAMVRWIAPILSFTADEIWKYIPGKRSQYVFTEEWYSGLFNIDKYQLLSKRNWDIFFYIRSKVNKVIEQARNDGLIKGSLEADIVLYTTPDVANNLRILNDELAFGLIISSIIILDSNNFDINKKKQENNSIPLKIVLKKSQGIKCLRCWNYTLNINQYENYSNICTRCIQNIVGPGLNRKFF